MDGISFYPFVAKNWDSLNLNIFEAAMFHGDTSWNFPNMSSPFNRIYFMIDGEGYLENETEKIDLVPGNMYLVPADSRYSYVCPNTMQKFYLHFSLHLLPGVDLFSRFKTVLQMPYEHELLERILADSKEESILSLLHLKATFTQIAYDFFSQEAKNTAYMDSFKGFYKQRTVLNYLATNLNASLRIQDLADALHMPVHQLSRTFQQDTGHGLKEYMANQLAQRARHLLLHTDMTIYEIADLLGFSDPYYFSRFFKKHEFVSPREYRKQRF